MQGFSLPTRIDDTGDDYFRGARAKCAGARSSVSCSSRWESTGEQLKIAQFKLPHYLELGKQARAGCITRENVLYELVFIASNL